MIEPPSAPESSLFVGLSDLAGYLSGAGWELIDEDTRTSLWKPTQPREDDSDFVVVLPLSQQVVDYPERIYDALRTVSYVERRSPEEVLEDIRFGAADTVAVRLTPDAPPGEAPLSLAYPAITALRSYVVASTTALDNHSLVLPARRPRQAELYTGGVRFSTGPGSFVLTLALPLLDYLHSSPIDSDASDHGGPEDERTGVPTQGELVSVPPQPLGRRVATRMLTVARQSQVLADAVGSGREPIRIFGRPNADAPNATELEALSNLGGPDKTPYVLRFAQSPLAPQRQAASTLRITPAQQRTLGEAADFLRTKQPRQDVTVEGLVVRLARDHNFGPGVVVVQGIVDDSGSPRRLHVQLGQADYNDAVQAHQDGYRVLVRGDLESRGTYRWVRPLRSFSVVPGLIE